MTKRLAVFLGVLCLCITLVFGAYWRSNRGTWHRIPVEVMWSGEFTQEQIDEMMNRPPEYMWIRQEDGAAIQENESFGEKMKRWFGWKGGSRGIPVFHGEPF